MFHFSHNTCMQYSHYQKLIGLHFMNTSFGPYNIVFQGKE